jgi:hypothetical protein
VRVGSGFTQDFHGSHYHIINFIYLNRVMTTSLGSRCLSSSPAHLFIMKALLIGAFYLIREYHLVVSLHALEQPVVSSSWMGCHPCNNMATSHFHINSVIVSFRVCVPDYRKIQLLHGYLAVMQAVRVNFLWNHLIF